MIIEKAEYANESIQRILDEHAPNAKAYSIFRLYDTSGSDHPSLRDRTEDMEICTRALARSDDVIKTLTFKGSELKERYGMEMYGAQFVQDFRIIIA